jgi:predicted GNAT family acetyltransferase
MKRETGDREEKLDEALAETFPASDPPANTVETGIGSTESAHSNTTVSNNPRLKRFELTVEDQTALLTYERTPETLTLIHTEVPQALRGQHLGEALVKAALDAAHAEGLRIIVVCPFAKAYLRKHRP